jgi:predicted nucleic-acid-binding Zn-ribbon protein
MIENGKCVVELPDYISAFVKEDGINIQTTNIKHGQVLWVEEIDVENNNFTIQTEKTTGTYEFYWDFTAVRKDVPDLEVEI